MKKTCLYLVTYDDGSWVYQASETNYTEKCWGLFGYKHLAWRPRSSLHSNFVASGKSTLPSADWLPTSRTILNYCLEHCSREGWRSTWSRCWRWRCTGEHFTGVLSTFYLIFFCMIQASFKRRKLRRVVDLLSVEEEVEVRVCCIWRIILCLTSTSFYSLFTLNTSLVNYLMRATLWKCNPSICLLRT